MTSDAQLAAAFCQQQKPTFTPCIGLVLGSGLGSIADQLTDTTVIEYSDIPGFPVSSVAGHQGKLHLGYFHGVPTVCMQGRVHYYEGADHSKIKTLVRTLKLLGCDTVLFTNSAGSLRDEVGVGEVVALSDHINFQFTNPLVGPNDDQFGERFVGMEDAYDPSLRKQLRAAARTQNITLHEGIYIGVLGPAFETPAEICAYRTMGADLVGMSTVAEVIIARHCGLKVAALSAVTNLAAGMHSEQLSHDITLKGAAIAAERMIAIITAFMQHYQEHMAS